MLRLTHHRKWSEVQALAGRWNTLLASSASDTVFLTWEWCEAWWKNYGGGRELSVWAVWDQEELIAIAPFFVDVVRRWGSRWQALRLIGDGSNDSDYLDCMIRRGREKEVTAALVRVLAANQEDWDWLEFHGTPAASPCLAAVLECAREQDWRFSCEPIPCATLPLPRRWEEYLKSLQPRFRSKVRSGLHLMQERFRSVPRACNTPEEIESWLPVLFDLHARRWQTREQSGVFTGAAKRSFYRDLSVAALPRGWLAFHRLEWGERPLALQYGLMYNNRFHLLQEGYEPAFAQLRPGLVLRAFLLRTWMEQGIEEYDFLAGTALHKMDWGAQIKQSARLVLAPSRKSAVVWIDVPRFGQAARKAIKQALPQQVLRIREELRQNGNHGADSASNYRASLSAWHRAISSAYFHTPLRRVGNKVVNAYSLARNGSGEARREKTPVCHIFILHRVNDEQDPYFVATPTKAFRTIVRFVKQTFPIVTLDQIVRGELQASRHNYHVAFTFDDGYRDNFLCAFPILKEFQVPATIYLATQYIDSGEMPWYDKVRLAFKLTMRSRLRLAELGGPDAALQGEASRLRALGETLHWLRALPEAKRLEAMSEIFRQLAVPASAGLPRQMLGWDEVRLMNREQITFGAHTLSHPALSRIPESSLRQEIVGSKERVEEVLQSPARHFAYPFGQAFDYTAAVKKAVQEAGFETAVTTIVGFNHLQEDLFELKRFTPGEVDPAMFALKLDWYRFRGLTAQSERAGGLAS